MENTTQPKNISRWIIISLFAVIIIIGSCSAGIISGYYIADKNISSYLVFPGSSQFSFLNPDEGGTPEGLSELFMPFWQAWNLVHEQYVTQPLDDVALMQGAIEGMINALGDEHSSYISPEELIIFNAQISGEEYEGIGAWVDVTKEYLTIISPMGGSPAEKAGLKPGDQIIAIDGEDMTGIDGELVRQRILGPAGTDLTLTILRIGLTEPFEVKLTRAAITSSNVISRMLDDNIAYIQLLSFGDKKTTNDLRSAIIQLLAQEPRGLVFDLRNNGGGLLDSAIEVASEFIPNGVIVYEQYGDGRLKTYNAKRGGKATEIPLIVLINEGSASASEIVAGAIQDHQRGQLVGATSYGKGSVQLWNNLVNEQGAVRITVAKWLTPNKRTISGSGLQPDVVIEINEQDFQEGIDPQLDKAIELVLSGQSSPK